MKTNFANNTDVILKYAKFFDTCTNPAYKNSLLWSHMKEVDDHSR